MGAFLPMDPWCNRKKVKILPLFPAAHCVVKGWFTWSQLFASLICICWHSDRVLSHSIWLIFTASNSVCWSKLVWQLVNQCWFIVTWGCIFYFFSDVHTVEQVNSSRQISTLHTSFSSHSQALLHFRDFFSVVLYFFKGPVFPPYACSSTLQDTLM